MCWHFWLSTTKFFSVVKSFNLTCSLHDSIQVDSLENLILICKSLGKAGLKLHQKTKRDPTAWILHFFDVDAWKNQESRLGWAIIGSQKCQKITKNAESYWKCQKSPKMPKLRDDLPKKECLLSGIAWIRRGGRPWKNFLALFLTSTNP